MGYIAFCVSDIEKSLEFYRDILGMKVIFDQVQDTTRGGLPSVYEHSRQTRRTVHLTIGEGDNAPHLVMTTHPGDAADGSPIKLDQVGISHYSFSVRDTKALSCGTGGQGCRVGRPAGELDGRRREQRQLLRERPGRNPGAV